jgi:P-type E1-E2 ATPase
MIEINVPGWKSLQLEHLVCDVNGTLAMDGKLLDGLVKEIAGLRSKINVHLITADTHGQQIIIDKQLNLQAKRLTPGDESYQKARFVESLGADGVVAIGQGANDAEMLYTAALGICVLSREGCAASALLNADIITPDIFAAVDLLNHPLRIVATLRK